MDNDSVSPAPDRSPDSPAGYRIAQVGIGTESSTFAPHRTGDDDFQVSRGDDVHAMAGHLTDHRLADFPQVEFVPLMDARAMPGGAVLPETFDRLTGEMVDLIAAGGSFDAVYLRLHGAVNVVGRLDAEAEFVRRVRAVVGDDALISASMDLHGQVSEALFRSVDILTCYRTAPHIDYAETQERACRDLAYYLTEGIRPVRALVRVPVLLPGEMTSTRLEPAASIYASLADDQHPDGVRDASLWVGYAWADEPRSAAAVVVHGTDEEAVRAEAMRVAMAWFDARSDFVFCAPADEPDSCIERALASPDRPFFVSDSGDNPTAGGSDDVAWFLGRLLAHPDLADGTRTAIWASCVATAAVAECVQAGPGARVDLQVGGQFGGSDPVQLVGEVVSVHENERSGPIAVVRAGGVSAILTTRRAAFHFVHQFTDLGLDPHAVDLTAVKIGYLEPDLFAAAADHLLALTPGGVNQKLTDLTYTQVVRPIHPLDDPDEVSALTLSPVVVQ
jgi:microcystin degradation protein MlrC